MSTNADENVLPISIDALKALVAKHLEQACAALPAHDWLWYETLELDELAKNDPEQAKRLLFGSLHDVLREREDDNSDALYAERCTIVRRVLDDVVDNELAGTIAAYAEKYDLDEADLAEDLKEHREFRPEYLEVPYVDTEYTYRGKIPVVADTPLRVGFAPGDDLFDSLRMLRISHEEFLSACKVMIEQKGLDFDEPGPFDENVLQGQGPETASDIYTAYAQAFNAAVMSSNDASLFHRMRKTGECVVDPAALVDVMRQVDDTFELFLHTSCSDLTVKFASTDLSREVLDLDATYLVAEDGVLADARKPGEVGLDLPIRGKLALPVSSFDVVRGRPYKVSSEVSITDDIRAGLFLLRELEQLCEHPSRFGKQVSSESIAFMADRVPAFRAKELIARISDLGTPEPVLMAINRLTERAATPLTDVERTSGLLSCLAPDTIPTPGRREHAMWLIEKGADVNATTENGVTPLMLATRAGEPELVSALLKAGADANKEARDEATGDVDTALSIGARALLRRQVNFQASVCVSELVAAAAVLPQSRLRTDRLDRSKVLSAPLVFAVSTGHVGLVRRTLEHSIESDIPISQRDLDTALYHAGNDKDVDIGCLLIEGGASPEGEVEHHDGQFATVVEALRANDLDNRGTTEGADQFLAMLRAHQARQAISRVTSAVRAPSSATPG